MNSTFQSQYKICDVCKSKNISLIYLHIVRNYGSGHFICNNGHEFEVNICGKTEYIFFCECLDQGIKILK